jgi:hypothetical protein
MGMFTTAKAFTTRELSGNRARYSCLKDPTGADPDELGLRMDDWEVDQQSEPVFDEGDDPTLFDVDYDQPVRMPLGAEELGQAEHYEMSPSEFVSKAVMVPDPSSETQISPFDFSKRRYLRDIYDTNARDVLLMAGRQVEKSFTLACLMITNSALRPRFKTLYVTPSAMQTKEFSKMKLREIIATSPFLTHFFPPHLAQNTLEQQAANAAWIKLRYAFLSADRCRGISTDMVILDEYQDFLIDNIGVIEHAASHSPYKLKLYAGTPKSKENPIEYQWQTHSTKCEWMVPCERHGTGPSTWYYQRLDEHNIGDKGLICSKCGSPINAMHGYARWVRTADRRDATFEGYRIPQIMVPWIDWRDIIKHRDHSPRAQFYNECLGISWDSGERPITREELIAACEPRYDMEISRVIAIIQQLQSKGVNIYAGVDWGADSSKSYTVIVIGAYVDSVFTILYAHRFLGEEAERRIQVARILQLTKLARFRRVGTDVGGGMESNADLLAALGSDRVISYQHTNPNQYMKWNTEKRYYVIHRTAIMAMVFRMIKRRMMRFPRWTNCFDAPYGTDILAIFSQYNEQSKTTTYMKPPLVTDDTFHAITYCFLASLIEHPRPDLFTPSAAIDRRLAEGRV